MGIFFPQNPAGIRPRNPADVTTLIPVVDGLLSTETLAQFVNEAEQKVDSVWRRSE